MDLTALFDIINSGWGFLAFLPILGYICWANPYEYNTFEDCVASIGGNERAIFITNEQAITDNLIIPTNITLTFSQGGSFNISAGKTVTINGHVDAGLYQIFEGTGAVAGLKKAHPQWFGATGDGITDDTTAIQAADNALVVNGVLSFCDGTYIISKITIANIKMIGLNKEFVILKHKANSVDNMIMASEKIELSDITIDGNKANQINRLSSLYFTSGTNLKIKNCIFKNTVREGIKAKDCYYIDIIENSFIDIGEHGAVLGENSFAFGVASSDRDMTVNIDKNRFINSAPAGGNDRAPGAIFLHGTEGGGNIFSIITNNYFSCFGTSFAANMYGNIDLYLAAGKATIDNNTFENIYYTAIKSSDGPAIIITNNRISSPAHDFNAATVYVGGTMHGTIEYDDAIISKNIIDNQYGHGILLQNLPTYESRRIIISDNIIKASDEKCIKIDGVTESVILEGNIMKPPSAGTGISIEDSSGMIEIHGNHIIGVAGAGYGIYGAVDIAGLDLIINDNYVNSDGTATYGICIEDAASVVCNNNRFIGDDPPVRFKNVTPLTVIGNQSDNLSPDFNVGLTIKISSENSWDTFYGTVVWDPANLVDGAGETSAGINVVGAALGDAVMVYPPYDMQDCLVYGYVQAANTVEIRIQNESTGARDFGNDTWKVKVIKY